MIADNLTEAESDFSTGPQKRSRARPGDNVLSSHGSRQTSYTSPMDELFNAAPLDAIRGLNEWIASIYPNMLESCKEPQLPTLFIVGAPRSGTTLLAQLLANTTAIGYVNNFVARFWLCPGVGALLDRSLGISTATNVDYSSRYGVTEGWAGPHEFSYFWRRWFPERETDAGVDELNLGPGGQTLQREFHALERVYAKPLFVKNLLCTLHVELLANIFPHAQFLLLERDPIYNVQSIMLMRQRRDGDATVWKGLRPKEYPKLASRPPEEQIVGQVYYMRQAALQAFSTLSPERCSTLPYERLCEDPRAVVRTILQRLRPDASNDSLSTWCSGIPEAFASRNERELPEALLQKVEHLCRDYFG